jgi:FtsP/CotA-like multicopper oxidase with cupredoxin domain
MQRRDFLRSGLQLSSLALAGKLPARDHLQMQMPATAPPSTPADITLTISPVTVELAPDRILSTIGYNGTSPGPVLRMKEGKPTTIDVVNQTDIPELVHWHGLLIPAEVDGVDEEGTPFIPPQSRRRYQFTPRPAGTRWYHSHAMAESDLHKGAYTGQFGFLVIDSASEPGAYDQEIFLALRDWEPFFTTSMEDTDEQGQVDPQPEKPDQSQMNTNPNGFEVNSNTYSINDKSLGAGEPLRVKEGQRVLFRILNASAIENRRLALPGHKFKILALDGNPVPNPALVETLFLGAGERIDALVEMSNPGVWVLGETADQVRDSGLGLIVEYANQHKQPFWHAPSTLRWDYLLFGNPAGPATTPAHTIDMLFEKIPGGSGKFNTWLVNGKPYPHANEFVLTQGERYRVVFRNRTDDAHPLHLHRHNLELTEVNGKPTSGIIKDTIVVPMYGRAQVDFTAEHPGLTLFHCHIQNHMDFGFKALFRYA